MSNTLVVVATIVAKPGHAQAVKAALLEVVGPSRAEAGCLRYELHSDNAQAGRFVMLEEWSGMAALELHREMPHIKALVERVGALLDIHVAELTKLA